MSAIADPLPQQDPAGSLLDAYAGLYGTGTLSQEVAPPLFASFRHAPSFLVLALVDQDGRVCVRPTPSGAELPWTQFAEEQGVIWAVERLAADLVPGCAVTDVSPIAAIAHAAGGVERRGGIACLARLVDIDAAAPTGAAFIEWSTVLDAGMPELHRAILVQLKPPQPAPGGIASEHEIRAVAGRPLQHRLHRLLVRPLIAPLSSRPLRRRVLAHCDGARSVLDVSCGDDELILALARPGRLCVANDVTAAQLRAVAARDAERGVVFSLHDATELPFTQRFDVALCKNTTHHLDVGQVTRLFGHLRRLADRVVFVDIVDVAASRRARAWNAYYRRVLGDQGHSFLSQQAFYDLVTAGFPDHRLITDHVDTVKGRYAIAVVSAPPSTEENP